MARLVLSPGPRTIEPMVGVGGQQPSNTSIYGSSLSRRVLSPTLVNSKDTLIGTPSFTSPKSTLSLSTFKLGLQLTSIGAFSLGSPRRVTKHAAAMSNTPPSPSSSGKRALL